MEQERINELAKTLEQDGAVAFLCSDLLIRIYLRVSDGDYDVTVYEENEDTLDYAPIDGGLFVKTEKYSGEHSAKACVEYACEWGA